MFERIFTYVLLSFTASLFLTGCTQSQLDAVLQQRPNEIPQDLVSPSAQPVALLRTFLLDSPEGKFEVQIPAHWTVSQMDAETLDLNREARQDEELNEFAQKNAGLPNFQINSQKFMAMDAQVFDQGALWAPTVGVRVENQFKRMTHRTFRILTVQAYKEFASDAFPMESEDVMLNGLEAVRIVHSEEMEMGEQQTDLVYYITYAFHRGIWSYYLYGFIPYDMAEQYKAEVEQVLTTFRFVEP